MSLLQDGVFLADDNYRVMVFRVVILTFDAMSIDQRLQLNTAKDQIDGYVDYGTQRLPMVASNVLVFMVRGVTSKWKQVIGHFFIGPSLDWKTLKVFVMKGLTYCTDIGLTVISVVCDQESSQRRLWRELGVSATAPGIHHPVTGNLVYVLPDPVHLLKGIRNNLMNHPVQVIIANHETLADADRRLNYPPQLMSSTTC